MLPSLKALDPKSNSLLTRAIFLSVSIIFSRNKVSFDVDLSNFLKIYDLTQWIYIYNSIIRVNRVNRPNGVKLFSLTLLDLKKMEGSRSLCCSVQLPKHYPKKLFSGGTPIEFSVDNKMLSSSSAFGFKIHFYRKHLFNTKVAIRKLLNRNFVWFDAT